VFTFMVCPLLPEIEILLLPDRKVGVYLICNFEIKFGFNLCPRLK
jgi:hypothetical protein